MKFIVYGARLFNRTDGDGPAVKAACLDKIKFEKVR